MKPGVINISVVSGCIQRISKAKAFAFKYLLKKLGQFNAGDMVIISMMTVKITCRENMKFFESIKMHLLSVAVTSGS